jgi:hypothetical protein
MEKSHQYPPEAFASNGRLWWTLATWPDRKQRFGDERKIAAWLAFNKNIGDRFTLPELREAIGDGLQRNDAEHLNRRLRTLRKDGWIVPSGKHDSTVGPSGYRLEKIGWHPALGSRPKDPAHVSNSDRVKVFKNDGSRCVICGIGDGEPYPDQPERKAVMTVGHRIAGHFKGRGSLDNLQTECALCNESIRAGAGIPETYQEVVYAVHELKKKEKGTLLEWLFMGRRTRSSIDKVYDRARKLSHGDRNALIDELRRTLGKSAG